ncbi:hypothetical protein PP639_gp071 [Arthrobacter phage Seahorse]|uniref:Uncharacterized protein n=1 Tax=Arthrobacter phage Seahorse TaxID=2419611 RepID=A0A3G3M5B2_9CAUD|nr:hypothetical protein PP639_gp071 [Arthrobacter phage Seahorse]AYR01571.1 hypothetical protein PBI_SEAHORSE_71 [Arthrobacter phage Seahorse]
MCNLLEHTERDAKLQQAKRAEPIYASLAVERGIPYEPPRTAEGGRLDFEDIRDRTGEMLRRIQIAPYIN